MEIRLKLMGTLKDQAPDGGTIELPDGATIRDVLSALQIADDSVQVFTINGRLERNKDSVLKAGEELSILPPVGGG